MPDDFDVPEWVSERRPATLPQGSEPPTAAPPAAPPAARPSVRPGARPAAVGARPSVARSAVARQAVARPAPRVPSPTDEQTLRRADVRAAARVARSPRPSTPAGGRHRKAPPGPSRSIRRRRTATVTVALVTVLTAFALTRGGDTPTTAAASTPTSAVSTRTSIPSAVNTAEPVDVRPTETAASAAPGQPIDLDVGTGAFTPIAWPAFTGGRTTGGRVVRLSLAQEGGLTFDGPTVAAQFQRILKDRRGWETQDGVRFVFATPAEVAKGQVDIAILIATPVTTEKLCQPLDTKQYTSCFNLRRAVLNSRRLIQGVPSYEGHLDLYRTYVVNHEIGHGIGHGHDTCPKANDPAPVMVPQTLRLLGCTINPYPVRPTAPVAAG